MRGRPHYQDDAPGQVLYEGDQQQAKDEESRESKDVGWQNRVASVKARPEVKDLRAREVSTSHPAKADRLAVRGDISTCRR